MCRNLPIPLFFQDERAIQKCRLFLLEAMDKRKNISNTINHELKFLKGGIQKMRTEVCFILFNLTR